MDAARSLAPGSSLESVTSEFQRYSEIASLIEVQGGGGLPIGGATDITPLIKKASKEGAYLSCEEFSQVKDLLSSIASLSSLASFPSFDDKFPITLERLNAFSDQDFFTAELRRVLDDDGGISDKASPELLRIRRELKGMRGRARRLIDELRSSEDFKEWLQEDFYTIRDDRYVLLIKAGYQTRFPGIIHGRSSSGETYFIEPYKVVELNNELSLLKKDEKAEEIRILIELSKVVVREGPGLTGDQLIIGSFDLDSAKAAFSKKLGCTVPELGEEGDVSLIGARHPLLILKEFSTGDTTVRPVDIRLDDGVRVLVVSGANTGGKTVALKTLGLITLMAQSAIPVPALSGSRLRVFSKVSADIGDSQGIAEDLSTFSGHITRLGSFLTDAAPGDLVLIDEIGVGTDPSEGSVLSLALLEEFSARGAVTVVSTHMNLLKAHAAVDEAFMNATVIFDKDTLEPSYNLSYGMPGQSLGLSIAGSLGIPESVVANARGKLTSDESAFIKSLKDINRERDRLIKLNDRLAAITEARDLALRKLRDERTKIVNRLRSGLEKKAKTAEEEIKGIVAAVKERERAARIKTGTADKAGRSAVSSSKAVARNALPDTLRPVKPYRPEEGDKVSVSGSSTKGVVVRVMAESKEVELKVGAMKIKAPWKKLEKTGGKLTRPERAKVKSSDYDYSVDAAYLINIIGKRVEESLKLVTRFLDDAHLAGLPEVEIVHGKGTGVLGAAIREFLATNHLVESYEQGDERGGGAGVTVVRLKG